MSKKKANSAAAGSGDHDQPEKPKGLKNVGIPVPLWQRIKARADQEERTVNREVKRLLERALEDLERNPDACNKPPRD